MSIGSGSQAPGWRPASSSTPPPPGPAWAAPPPPRNYRARWWKLLLVALLGFGVLAAVVWVALWIRPPEPARLIVLKAGYDTNLAVPVNPYGKSGANNLAKLCTPGGWFGNRPKLNGTPEAGRFARGSLLPDLEKTHEKCVVVMLAAHGGRDRDGAFLFPDDATANSSSRIRVKAIIDRLASLPANKQKLLILDATQPSAYTDLGIVHNDFAAALVELEADIAAVPNLVVFSSTDLDQRSWSSPDWGTSAFNHYLTHGLNGAADADGDKRISAWELIEYVRPHVQDWARDHRAARQTSLVLPRDDAERRAKAMHLAMTDGKTPTEAAPVPWEPPVDIEQIWTEYRDLARATPPPEAYTPQIWREYEAWVLRFEELILAGDIDGAKAVRVKASDAKRRIEAVRRLNVSPQTLALPAGVGGVPYLAEPPAVLVTAIARVADPALPIAQRPLEWAKVQPIASAFDPAQARLLWSRAFMQWVADDPPERLKVVPEVLPLLTDGLTIRPAELHFLAMLAAYGRPETETRSVTLVRDLLKLRWEAEAAAMSITGSGYPYAEYCLPYVMQEVAAGDQYRRQAEDLSFATEDVSWSKALANASLARMRYEAARKNAEQIHIAVAAWHAASHRLPSFAEWLARDPNAQRADSGLEREAAFQLDVGMWGVMYANISRRGWNRPPPPFDTAGRTLPDTLASLDGRIREETFGLLGVRPEFEGRITPRADSVRWLHRAEAVLTAPPVTGISPVARVDFLRQVRRVTRQLQVTGRTQPEPLAEVSETLTRERAFDAARRRGQLLLARLGEDQFQKLTTRKPGDSFSQVQFRLRDFAARAEGRKSLVEAEVRLGEVLAALPAAADVPGANASADQLTRIVPAHTAAAFRHNPPDQLRRADVREVLAFQAKRTLLDHWYGENNSKYYLRAIGQLRADADKIFPLADRTKDEFAELVKTDDDPFPVVPVVPTRFVMTDEPEAKLALDFTRTADRSGRPGFPVFWASPAFQRSEVAVPPARTPQGTEPEASAPPFTRVVLGPVMNPKPVMPVAIPGKMTVTGFYRGRTITKDVAVNAYPVPDRSAVNFPIDPTTAIAVRADPALVPKLGTGNGTVVIVLDCSGSMRPPVAPKLPPPHPDETLAVNAPEGLFATAARSLETLLVQLPPGTVVSVRTFGRRSSGATTAEGSIQTLLPPTRLEFDRSKLLEKVMSEVNGITIGDLWHESPIVRAVVEAKDWLNAHPELPGPFKSVVLISDESENRVWKDPRFAEPKREIKDILKAEFNNSGVYFSVVALKVLSDADKKLQDEFKSVASLNPPGVMVPPEQTPQLVKWLYTGLLPRIRYSLVDANGDAVELTAASVDPDNWYTRRGLTGPFKVRVSGDLNFEQDVFLKPGDRLWLNLAEENGDLRLTRRWFARSWPGALAQTGTAKWRLAAFQNFEKAGQLRIVAGLDDAPGPQGVVVQSRSADAWFDLKPEGPPISVRWRPEPGFPGSTWAITVPGGWPGGPKAAPPALDARWSGPLPFTPRGPWSPSASDRLPTIEEHLVEVASDQFELRRCLVVRLSWAPDDPLWLRPAGFTSSGSEVRFFLAANRTTCLFWWADPQFDPASLKPTEAHFEVVSLKDALTDADAASRHLKLDTLPSPSDKSMPPTPPLAPVPSRN